MSSCNLVVIGSSTGGLKILEEMFRRLPVLNTAILIVQHITPIVDQAFVSSLARISKMSVSLACDGQEIANGRVYLAPGGVHLRFVRNQRVSLFKGEKVNSVCPSIDVTMQSLVRPVTGKLAGVILTGMGCDGAAGVVHMKNIGGTTVAQDQNSSIIYGMPKAAAETGMIDFILATDKIADKLVEIFG